MVAVPSMSEVYARVSPLATQHNALSQSRLDTINTEQQGTDLHEFGAIRSVSIRIRELVELKQLVPQFLR